LPKFVTFNASNDDSVGNLSWNTATLQLIFNFFESWKRPFSWGVSDNQAKK